MNKEETNKIIKVANAYKDLKASIHLTALHTTKVLDRFVKSYQNSFIYSNRDEEEKSITALMDTIKYTYSIAEQHKSMQGIIGGKLRTLFHSIYGGINEDNAFVKFPEESHFELSSKTAFAEIISALQEVCYMLDEYKVLLKAKGKLQLAETTDILKSYFQEELIPYYSEFSKKVDNVFINFNTHKRGYAVAIKEIPLKVISKKLVAYNVAQDRPSYARVEVQQSQSTQNQKERER